MRSKLPEPDWDQLLGGDGEEQWIADKNSKAERIAACADSLLRLADELEQRGAVSKASPGVIRDVHLAADWYVALAAYAMKTLGYVRETALPFGLRTKPKTFLEGLRNDKNYGSSADLVAFCRWVNAEIEHAGAASCTKTEALSRVSLVFGGRIIGQGQNQRGTHVVSQVLAELAGLFDKAGHSVTTEVDGRSIPWRDLAGDEDVPAVLMVGGRLHLDLRAGGDRPDLIATSIGDGTVIAVAEVKGRRDVSNAWESWMPQVADHSRTWAEEYGAAERILFATLINRDMVDGMSARGTRRQGFRSLYGEGLLTGVANITHLVSGQPYAVDYFKTICDLLALRSGLRKR